MIMLTPILEPCGPCTKSIELSEYGKGNGLDYTTLGVSIMLAHSLLEPDGPCSKSIEFQNFVGTWLNLKAVKT